MKKVLLFAALGLGIGITTMTACRQSDPRTMIIRVPEMADARAVRIVTNAALDEVAGRYDGITHEYEADLSKRIILYHESHRLRSPAYQRRIVARIREVGYDARFLRVGHNPPDPVPTVEGPAQMWPNRFTAAISVPGMVSNTDVNIVADAIAYARLGRDDPRIRVDPRARRLTVGYESLHQSFKNVEYAIACAGYAANGVPAKLGLTDGLPYGWIPVSL